MAHNACTYIDGSKAWWLFSGGATLPENSACSLRELMKVWWECRYIWLEKIIHQPFMVGFFFWSVLRFLQSKKWMKASPTETPPLSRYYSTHPNALESQKKSPKSVWHGTFSSLKNCTFLFVKGPEIKLTPEDYKEDDVLISHQPAGRTR